MKKILAAVLALIFLSTATMAQDAPTNAPLTSKEVAEKLGKSVVALTDYSGAYCSAAKIGPKQFLTALHCVGYGDKVTLSNGRILKIKSVLAGLQEKPSAYNVSGRDEDWAIINTKDDDDTVVALEIGCSEEVYLGQEIAYAGFPHPTQYALGFGKITTVKPVLGGRNNLDYGMDVHAAPGASGSAVISVDTGKVIGILTEGIAARTGFFMVGLESVKNMDVCETAPAPATPKAPTADALEK
jgi:V8-like Glu-specific endopeptidase